VDDPLALLGPGGDGALLLGLAATRVAVAFLLVPLFTAELIPALVRNAMFMSIALLSLLVQPQAGAPLALSTVQWVGLFGKEAFIGGALYQFSDRVFTDFAGMVRR
jgi:type III secretion protein T